MFDAGVVTICGLKNTAAKGAMPKEELSAVAASMFEERAVGYGRYYAAQGVNERIDMVIRIWRCTECRIGMYAVLSQSENDGQYRIGNVQHLTDKQELKVTDLTLTRLEKNYDLAAEA